MHDITDIRVIRKEELRPGDVLIISYPYGNKPPNQSIAERLFSPAKILFAQDHFNFRIISAGQAAGLKSYCAHIWDTEDRVCLKCDLSKREASL